MTFIHDVGGGPFSSPSSQASVTKGACVIMSEVMLDDSAQASPQSVGTAAAAATPSREEVRAIARRGGYRRVPVRRELFADAFTTIQVLRRLRAASDHVFLLESAKTDRSRGRYSFIGYNPSLEITCLRGELRVREGVEDGEERVTTRHVAHPGAALREILAGNRATRLTGFPPFCGGLVGFFSFDYLAYVEPCLRRAEPLHDGRCRADAPDVDLMLFDKLVVFDAYRQRLALIANVRVNVDQDEGALDRAYRQAVADLDEMELIVRDGPCATFPPLRLAEALTPARGRDGQARRVHGRRVCANGRVGMQTDMTGRRAYPRHMPPHLMRSAAPSSTGTAASRPPACEVTPDANHSHHRPGRRRARRPRRRRGRRATPRRHDGRLVAHRQHPDDRRRRARRA